MTKLVVAEKPSVARDIARVLGASRKGDGFLEGNGYRVTWALGHLIQFAEPDAYGDVWSGRWSLDQLPMIPERWRLKVGTSTAKHFKLVKSLINAPETERIVCATDAGREGEHIFRLIYEHARCRKPFDRLWVSSLTDEAIRAGFAGLQPGSAFDPLAAAARARAQADWLVGMNLTRAYTVHNRVLCTIGRVQTPTLAMIVARDAEIASFTKAYFYELVAHFAEGFDARYAEQGETRIDEKERAERLLRELSPHETGTVSKVEKKVRRNRPPPLYDLTNLQRDANRRFGLTAAQVLEHAQSLYETHKLISYPRTESRHISEDMLPQLPGILRNLEHPLAAEALQRLESGHQLGKAYVDRTKLTDHHAILPTGRVPPATLPAHLRRIYDLVATRFVAVFLPDQQVEETRVEILIGDATFLARGSLVLDPGWKRAELRPERHTRTKSAEGDSKVDGTKAPLPPLEPGQVLRVRGLEVVEKETKPPKPFDDATLLVSMKNAGRTIEDDALASVMADSGLGTPATRAETIEKLIRAGYVERQRKQIRATPKGQALMPLIAAQLRSPELTAEWERRLKEIELGREAASDFGRDIESFVRELVPAIGQGPALSPEQRDAVRQGIPSRQRGGRRGAKGGVKTAQSRSAGLGSCPICKQGEITESARAYGCSRYRSGCGFTIWRQVAGVTLSEDQARALIERGFTDRIDGFRSKAGRSFAAVLRLDGTGKVVMDFETAKSAVPDAAHDLSGVAAESGPTAPDLRRHPLLCPKCGQGQIIEGRRGYGCNRYREGCDFVVWKRIEDLVLSEPMLRELVSRGETAPIVLPCDAEVGGHRMVRLKLDEQWGTLVEPVADRVP
ncbi:DNA topoisomerase III [Thiorhodococcus drewsii AZ1]|uniref:DNA topoisomerase n=1 Tax=Thiorhodococcus drewsii AZ1 TaxID=765913 RepID=G2DWT9_9GAMM|nr:DNA topoisomerase 3 [Thiorhodococcus drewsii]EGV33293.1 DNA topoisomerase III [Thiorhodococcus drewsii AZ1]